MAVDLLKPVIVLSICIFISGITVRAKSVRDGTCGENLIWTVEGDTLTIKGEGSMYDYNTSSTAPWQDQCYSLVHVVIESGVTSIGNYAFRYCEGFADISIPNTVVSIGNYSFFSSTNLASVDIPSSVKTIGKFAFRNCAALSTVVFHEGLTSIGKSAFYFSGVKSVIFPDSLTSIDDSCFSYCVELVNVTLGSHVKTIGTDSFSQCTNLAKITLSDSLTAIGSTSFSSCPSLTSVHIPANVDFIGDEAFYNCKSLVSIDVDEKNKYFKSIDGVLYDHDCTTLLLYPPAISETSFFVPYSVKSIQSKSFAKNPFLKDLVISDNVELVGEFAFEFCSALEHVVIPGSVTSIGNNAFSNCGSLAMVFYQGSNTSFSTSTVLSSCASVDTVCVSPDYHSSDFCGKPVNQSASICQTFQSGFTRCFQCTYMDGTIMQERRRTTRDWEKQSNGCMTYKCDDVSGEISWSECNSTGKQQRVCMDGICNVYDQLKTEGWLVEIEVNESMKPTEINVTGIAETISNQCGVEAEKVSIGLELDKEGNVARIIVMIKDEETANVIADGIMSKCQDVKGCLCGDLCRAKSITITAMEEWVSGADHLHEMKLLLIVSFIQSFLMVLMTKP